MGRATSSSCAAIRAADRPVVLAPGSRCRRPAGPPPSTRAAAGRPGAGKAAVELAERRPRLRRRDGVDQIANRLRLDQVELAVEHGAAGEFAGRRGPAPPPDGAPQEGAPERAARRGRRAPPDRRRYSWRVREDGVEAAIDRLPAGGAEASRAERCADGSHLEAVDRPARHLEASAAAQAHDRQGGPAGRGGERGDRIGKHAGILLSRPRPRRAPIGSERSSPFPASSSPRSRPPPARAPTRRRYPWSCTTAAGSCR